ncbi:MAG: homoserine dehydrogenase [bacterium]|nr:homoserine dehydrogenase [bacterium]
MVAPSSAGSGAAPAACSAPARIGVGILGGGTVGAALVGLLDERRAEIAARCGVELVPVAVAVRSPDRPRPGVPADLLTGDAAAVVAHPDTDVVVELIGGIEPARELLLAALAAGKPVVTANKEVLADHGAELFAAARAAGVDLLFEAAVGGAIPLVRALRESLAGESVRRIMGIVNGTTNYILSRMTTAGASYLDALAEAQALGYAEADPRADVEGHDAAAKAAIMAAIVFGAEVTAADVYCEGISTLSAGDITFARRLGHVIKLLAIVERTDGDVSQADGASNGGSGAGEKNGAGGMGGPNATSSARASEERSSASPHPPGCDDSSPRTEEQIGAPAPAAGAPTVAVRVHPAMVPEDHPLAAVRDSFNAVFVEGDAAGELMLYGRGAGGRPTASAVLGDLIDAAVNLRAGAAGKPPPTAPARIHPIDELHTAYYLELEVIDRPGVLAAVAGVFGRCGVSIRSMEQEGLGEEARIIFITHVARERDMRATLEELRHLEAVRQVGSVLRVIADE